MPSGDCTIDNDARFGDALRLLFEGKIAPSWSHSVDGVWQPEHYPALS